MEKIKKLIATPAKVNRKISNADVDDLIIHILFFSLIKKEERTKVIEPFYNFTKQRYDDVIGKMEKYKSQLDKFALLTLEYGIPLLKLNMEMYQKLMEIE